MLTLPLTSLLLRTARHSLCCSLLLQPESLEMIGMAQVNRNPDDVSVFHGLPNLNVLVREDLHLLPIIPECRVEAVQQNRTLRSVHVFQCLIISFVTKADKYLL